MFFAAFQWVAMTIRSPVPRRGETIPSLRFAHSKRFCWNFHHRRIDMCRVVPEIPSPVVCTVVEVALVTCAVKTLTLAKITETLLSAVTRVPCIGRPKVLYLPPGPAHGKRDRREALTQEGPALLTLFGRSLKHFGRTIQAGSVLGLL